jgi:HEAT repeat protein
VSVPDLPPGVSRLLTDFRGQLLPSLREVAAEAMTRECQRCPERVVPALMEGAQSDPAPTVRACCARCLGELRFRTLSCRSLLESLRGDEDPRVRAEAEWALARFNQP